MNVEYAPVALQACEYVSSCTNAGQLSCRPWWLRRCGNGTCSSLTSSSVVEEDHRLLLTSEPKPITLPDGTTRSLGPAVRDAFAIFEGPSLLGNGERS